MLPADELEAIVAHELSPVKNRDTLTQAVATTVAGAITYRADLTSLIMEDNGGTVFAP
jgi:heat shock protein HtpX